MDSPESSRWFVEEVLPSEPPLRAYLRRSLPSEADVDDVVQESFLRILHAKRIREIRHPKSFLFAIARNLLRDWFHKKSVRSEITITEREESAVIIDDTNLFESICREQELALLAEAIKSLPERCREVMLLRKIKGLSQRAIAEMLNISENTVESLAAKGVRRCTRFLQSRISGKRGAP